VQQVHFRLKIRTSTDVISMSADDLTFHLKGRKLLPSSKRLGLITVSIAYFYAFVLSYQQMIALLYGYQFFYVRQVPAWYWLTMGTLAVLPTTILDIGFDRVSSLVTWVIYFATVVPCCVVPEMINDGPLMVPLECSLVIVSSFMLLEFVRKGPLFRFRSFHGYEYLCKILLPAVVIAAGITMMYWDNFRLDIKIGADNYLHRFEARDIVQSESASGYLLSIFGSTALPMVIGDAIALRSVPLGGIALFGAITTMSFKGGKAEFFAPIICGIAIWVATRQRRAWWSYILAGHVLLLIVSALELFILGTPWMLALGPVREQAVPAKLTAYYFDFAERNPPLLLRDSSIMRAMGARNPLGQDLPRFVGEQYDLVEGQNANANIWASAQVELPYIGPVLASILAGFMLRLLDSIVAMKGSRRAWILGASLCAVWSLAWSNGAIQTTLLSNGIVTGLLFLYLLPRQDSGQVDRVADHASSHQLLRRVRVG
jgi:hypothetical protein